VKVPDRFLGYAFCVGDILLEVTHDFIIKNADGALTLLSAVAGDCDAGLTHANLLDCVLSSDATLIEQTRKALTGNNRLGLLCVNFKLPDGSLRPMILFMSRLPVTPDVIYIFYQSLIGLVFLSRQKPTSWSEVLNSAVRIFSNK